MQSRTNNLFSHVLDSSRWRPQRQAVALITLGLFVAIIIGALYLSQSASTSTLGRQLEELIAVRDDLEQQNEQLRAEIASLRSIPRLITRATELGFTSASEADIEYLVVQGYNPHRAETVAPLEPQAEPLPEYDESFTGWLTQQWDLLTRQLESFSQQEPG